MYFKNRHHYHGHSSDVPDVEHSTLFKYCQIMELSESRNRDYDPFSSQIVNVRILVHNVVDKIILIIQELDEFS